MPKQLPSDRIKELMNQIDKGTDERDAIAAILQFLDEREAKEQQKVCGEPVPDHSYTNFVGVMPCPNLQPCPIHATPVKPSKDEGNKTSMPDFADVEPCPCPDGIPGCAVYHTKLKHKHSNVYIVPDHPPQPKGIQFYNDPHLGLTKEEAEQFKCDDGTTHVTISDEPKPRWKPTYKVFYWTVNEVGTVLGEHWFNKYTDNQSWEFGNCFQTREKAEAAAQAIRDLLMKMQGE